MVLLLHVSHIVVDSYCRYKLKLYITEQEEITQLVCVTILLSPGPLLHGHQNSVSYSLLFVHKTFWYEISFVCLTSCGISINHNFLFSIIHVYWRVFMLHVSVILTIIMRFINNNTWHCSLLKFCCNGSIATGLTYMYLCVYVLVCILQCKTSSNRSVM
jgi:hypothetical protein